MQISIVFNLLLAFVTVANGATHKRLLGNSGNPDFPDPNVDPFYKVPSSVASYQNGDVISSREVPTTINQSYYDKSYQILYKTQNSQNEGDATVATVWTPKKPKSESTVFSWQVFEDSTQLNCNPSWAFINKSKSTNTITTSVDAPFYIQWALEQGYYVIAPDHLGSNSAFIAGFQEGYAVLDGIRATIKFNKLSQSSKVAIAGYSGGAHATAWAANLAGKYAPELNIVGAVHGGTPVDTRGIYNYLLGGLFSGFAGAGLSGLTRAYDELNTYVQSIVTEQGRKDLQKVASPNTCLLQIVTGFAFKNFSAETTVKSDPLNQPIPKKYLARESLLSNVSSVGVNVPKFPTFQFHASLDEVVPRDQHEQFIQQQCSKGAKIQYHVLPIQDHVAGVAFSIPGGIKALEQIYAGTLDTSKCGSPDLKTNIVSPDSEQAEQILGSDAVAKLRSFNGKQTEMGKIAW